METAIFFSYLFAKCAVYPCFGQCFVVLYYAEWNTGGARGYCVVMARAVILIFMSGMDSSEW